MTSRAQKIRIDLTTSVRHALEDGLIASGADTTRVDFDDLAKRAVEVFAVLLGENPPCCKGGPQWGHDWDCPTLP